MRSLRLDPELHEKVQSAAAALGESVSEFIRRSAETRADHTLTGSPSERFADVAGTVSGGATGRRSLWRLVQTGRLVIADLSQSTVDRAAYLMDKYSDTPMDLADATLVALAEEQGHRRIFTLNPDFHVYRLRGRQYFEVVPGP